MKDLHAELEAIGRAELGLPAVCEVRDVLTASREIVVGVVRGRISLDPARPFLIGLSGGQ